MLKGLFYIRIKMHDLMKNGDPLVRLNKYKPGHFQVKYIKNQFLRLYCYLKVSGFIFFHIRSIQS